MEMPPYQQGDGVYILARGNKEEYHIAKIIGKDETSNPGSVGNASTRCLRYYKSYEYSITDKEPPHDQICRKCQSKRYQRIQ
ncbi:MAG: hypothetical protein ABI347_06900 [Nitrososphaera sp.]